MCRSKRLNSLLKNLFRVSLTVDIPAGSKLYVHFYEQDIPIPPLSLSTMLKIEFRDMPNVSNRDLFGKLDSAHLEVYGPFDVNTQCKITFNSTINNRDMRLRSKFKIGLYERQMVLPLGDCGNLNHL